MKVDAVNWKYQYLGNSKAKKIYYCESATASLSKKPKKLVQKVQYFTFTLELFLTAFILRRGRRRKRRRKRRWRKRMRRKMRWKRSRKRRSRNRRKIGRKRRKRRRNRRKRRKRRRKRRKRRKRRRKRSMKRRRMYRKGNVNLLKTFTPRTFLLNFFLFKLRDGASRGRFVCKF